MKHKPKPIKYKEVTKNDSDIYNIVTKKDELQDLITKNPCHTCYKKPEHFILQKELRSLQIDYQKNKNAISEQNLKYFNEFKNRILILQKLEYIDKNNQITLKGTKNNLY